MSVTLSPWPLVRQGDKGHPVISLQYLLGARRHDVVVDSLFGAGTDAAVRDFQHEKGLPVDGVVGPLTWRALIVQVRRGNDGPAVRAVQEEFQFRNLSGDPSRGPQVDGVFGPQTEYTVRTFQQAIAYDVQSSFPADGIVGPLTWQALIGAMLAF